MAERGAAQRLTRRVFLYPVQGLFIGLLFLICRYMPINWASALGAWIFSFVGPRLRADKVARRNLKRCYPNMTQEELDRTVSAVWENLGRGAGEWGQVDLIPTKGPNSRVEIVGEEIMNKVIADGGPFIAVSAHMGNWEIGSLVPAQRGAPMVNVYRTASIPIVDFLFRKIRGRFSREMIPKGRANARRIIAALKEGHPLGLLVDQKLNEGLPIPFFGRDAMTPSAPAELALRFNCPLIPVRIERLPNVRFRLTIYPPMEFPETGNRKEDVRILLTRINAMIEGWIRERPEQWFWVHRRWPD
ncbi:lauroyl acyltransferase [Hwanghaeella grinnelliae]|uniref:Lauroyl acyltransferase n=1 Tax=Hwanghaeella grinnelliae TaxID=2500179 RepID=A0A3S2WSK4_9PROT|nr:lysophospholipid acyltransferase family protein [Hwanghaeella grinnelliae]RVU36829.1 lauroyl acyltransferase [Hwanghaeella grinnelliae]